MAFTELIDVQHEGENYRVCEACGAQFHEEECKLKCARCGYVKNSGLKPRACSRVFEHTQESEILDVF